MWTFRGFKGFFKTWLCTMSTVIIDLWTGLDCSAGFRIRLLGSHTHTHTGTSNQGCIGEVYAGIRRIPTSDVFDSVHLPHLS